MGTVSKGAAGRIYNIAEMPSELERRYDAFARLLAIFRAVHAGVDHDLLTLPAYGGHLFDPDRFPFLERRAPGTNWREAKARPLPINNRTVLHLLEALQFLEMKVPGSGADVKRHNIGSSSDLVQPAESG